MGRRRLHHGVFFSRTFLLEGRKSDEEQDGMRSTTFGQFGTRKVILAKLLHYGSKTNLI